MADKRIARRALLRTTGLAAGVATAGIAAQMRVSAQSRTPKKVVLKTDKAGAPVGPYSQGIRAGNFVFVAGEKGFDPKTNKMVPGGIVPETRQTFENIRAILAEGGATLDDVVASTVHMVDLSEFETMNKIYAEYFKVMPPGRTTVQVLALPAGARIEITVIAIV